MGFMYVYLFIYPSVSVYLAVASLSLCIDLCSSGVGGLVHQDQIH